MFVCFLQKSEKKVRGSTLKQYTNPVRPESLPGRPFVGSMADGEGGPLGAKKARYKVVVTTGNQHNCGTDAQVCCVRKYLG